MGGVPALTWMCDQVHGVQQAGWLPPLQSDTDDLRTRARARPNSLPHRMLCFSYITDIGGTAPRKVQVGEASGTLWRSNSLVNAGIKHSSSGAHFLAHTNALTIRGAPVPKPPVQQVPLLTDIGDAGQGPGVVCVSGHQALEAHRQLTFLETKDLPSAK